MNTRLNYTLKISDDIVFSMNIKCASVMLKLFNKKNCVMSKWAATEIYVNKIKYFLNTPYSGFD